MICIILTRVYYCRGLPAASEGYFVLPAALSLVTGYCTRLSCVMVVWRYVETQDNTIGIS